MATLAGTVAGAVANFAMLAVVGQVYGVAAFGVFSGITAVFLVLSMVTRLGADQGAVWSVARLMVQGRRASLGSLLRVALTPVLIFSVSVSALVFLGSSSLARLLGDADRQGEYASLLKIMAIAMPVAAVGEVLLGATRGFGSMRPTIIASQFGRQVGQLILVGIAVLLSRDLRVLIAAWSIPYLAVVIYPAWWLRRNLDLAASTPREWREFWRYSASQAANQSAQIGLEKLDIILLGPLASLAAQGSYNAANRLAHLVVLAWYAVNLPHSALWGRLFEQRRHEEVSRSAKTATGWGMLVVGPLLVAFLLFGQVWTGFLSPGLEQGGVSLAVLAGGLLVALQFGPCENLLLMAGGSGRSFVNNLIALTVDVALNVLLIPRYGAVGAAIAWVVALFVVRALATWQLRRDRGVTAYSSTTFVALGLVGATYGIAGIGARVSLGSNRLALFVAVLVASPFYLALIWTFRKPLQLPELPKRRRLIQSPAAQSPAAWTVPASFASMVDGPQIRFKVRSAAATAAPVSAARLRLLIDVVPVAGWRGRIGRRFVARLAPGFVGRPELLPLLHRDARLELPFGGSVVAEILEQAALRLDEGFDDVLWLLPPARRERRVGALLLAGDVPVGHLRMVEQREAPVPKPTAPWAQGLRSGVSWPVVLDRWVHDGVACELSTPLPLGAYRPARLDTTELLDVVDDLGDALSYGPVAPRDGEVPMHGDLTPWNLLRSKDGRLVLFDWEHVGFGPPESDLVHYLSNSPTGLRHFARLPPERRLAVPRAASFWLHERERRSFGEYSGWKRRGRRQEIHRLEIMGGRPDVPTNLTEGFPALAAALAPRPRERSRARGHSLRFGSGSPGANRPRLVASAKQHRRLIAVCAAMGALLAPLTGLSGWKTTVVSARVSLRDPWGIDPTLIDRPVGGDFERFVRAQRQLFVSAPVVDSAAREVGESPAVFARSITVLPDPSSTLLAIEARGSSTSEAERRLDALVDAYGSARLGLLTQSVASQLDTLEKELAANPDDDELSERAAEIKVGLQRYGTGVALVQIEGSQRVSSLASLATRGLLGALGGLALGAAGVWTLALGRRRVLGVASLRGRLGIDGLGDVATVDSSRRTSLVERAGYASAGMALSHRLVALKGSEACAGSTILVTGSGSYAGLCLSASLLAQGLREGGHPASVMYADDTNFSQVLDRLEATGTASDLLVLGCPAPTDQATALRLCELVDIVVLALPAGIDISKVETLLAMFRRLESAPLVAMIAMADQPGR